MQSESFGRLFRFNGVGSLDEEVGDASGYGHSAQCPGPTLLLIEAALEPTDSITMEFEGGSVPGCTAVNGTESAVGFRRAVFLDPDTEIVVRFRRRDGAIVTRLCNTNGAISASQDAPTER